MKLYCKRCKIYFNTWAGASCPVCGKSDKVVLPKDSKK